MLALAFAAAIFQGPTDWPLTRAERTNFAETSHYEDVVAFIQALQSKGAPVQLVWMGDSTDGHNMPLVIASRPPMPSAEAARRSGRPIIYIQANIHAGEVEGKEAAQALLRDWCKAKDSVLDHAVILMTPIYNIDGNEKWGPVERNRPEQDGPALVGVRPNGQNFDLNRDCIKAESPETRGILEYVYKGWDPDVVFDLHTTDGTRHGFELTYSPPLNPNTDQAVLKYTRDELLPTVRYQVRQKYGYELFDYGNAERRGLERNWYSFEPLGRYVTNYAGLRNRIGILSEATTYIPFKARVVATEQFVQTCLDNILKNPKRIVDMTRKADESVIAWGNDPSKAPALGVAWDFQSRGKEDVPLEKLAPGEKAPLSGRPKAVEKVRMSIYDRFQPTKTAPFPAAYLIAPAEGKLVELLRRHGVLVERLLSDWSGDTQAFTISKATQAANPYQGHKLIRLEGTFAPRTMAAEKGFFLVRTAQPLGTLAFYLLEPENGDSAAAWEYASAKLEAGALYPVYKIMRPPSVASETIK